MLQRLYKTTLITDRLLGFEGACFARVSEQVNRSSRYDPVNALRLFVRLLNCLDKTAFPRLYKYRLNELKRVGP